MISFYDFDQDHADGAKGYLRESMYVTNFTSLFLSDDTSLEYEFSPSIAAKMSAYNPALYATFLQALTNPQPGGLDYSDQYRGGIIPMRTFTDWPWDEDRRLAIHTPAGWDRGIQRGGSQPRPEWPPTDPNRIEGGATGAQMQQLFNMYDYTSASIATNLYNGPYRVSDAVATNVFSSGVIMRSTEQGTGPPLFPKTAWLGCQGDCMDGMTPGNEVCNTKTITCDNNWFGTVPWGNAFGNTCSQNDIRCGVANSAFAGHMTFGTENYVGCGFVDNNRPRYDPGMAVPNPGTIATGPFNATWGRINYFGFPTGCYSNTPSATTGVYAIPLHPSLYDDNMACILDCPRTAVRDDCAPQPASRTDPARNPRRAMSSTPRDLINHGLSRVCRVCARRRQPDGQGDRREDAAAPRPLGYLPLPQPSKLHRALPH